AEPPGARVFVAGEERGVTPLRLDNLPPGTHKVSIAALGFEPVEMEVPIYKDNVTEISGRLGDRYQPTAAEVEDYADDKSSNSFWGWTKMGSAAVCCAAGVPCASLTSGTLIAAYAGGGGAANLGSAVCGGLTTLCALGVCS